MATKEVSVTELQKLEPKRFEREYWSWVENHWWDGDWIIEDFVARQDEIGILDIHSNDISWSGFYSQGDGLAFDARVDVLAFMRLKGYDKTHMPLYLDMENYGVGGKVSRGDRYSTCFSQGADIDFAVGNCEPAGVFSGMEQEAWDELVHEQCLNIMDDLANEIHEYASDAACELYRALEEDYDASTSEEEFIESCLINEVTFEIEVDDEDTDEDCGQGLVAERSAV
jgi:hypothetical protein